MDGFFGIRQGINKEGVNKEGVNAKGEKQPTFKGKQDNFLAKIIGKSMDSEWVQNFSKNNKDSNFPMHINALKDIIATSTFVAGTAKSKKIKDLPNIIQ